METFGPWLRRRRMALGIAAAELADRAHCSVSALRKIERNERRPSMRLAERLAACLDIPAAERARFVTVARGERRVDRLTHVGAVVLPPLPELPRAPVSEPLRWASTDPRPEPLADVPAPPHNLPPQPTSFIGRERELGELRQLLGTTRLLTLTGAGGSGKTRLALQLATGLPSEWPDGAGFVDLVALADPALVAPAAAAALGLAEKPGRAPLDTLADHLRGRRALLLLDNCEHLAEACAGLAQRLLGASHALKIIATSREPLGVPGEIAWPVPALSLPEPNDSTVAALLGYEAVRLFVERARFAQPAFEPTDANAPAIARICRQLDGMPLALELAAARVRMFPVEQIAGRLADRFRLLVGGRGLPARHQTLRAAIDWSYAQLAEPERVLWRCLAVFSGGFTLDAAEAVCGAGLQDSVIELLPRLVDKSLVAAEPAGGEARFRLLGTLREYALELLAAAGEMAALRDRHLEWCVQLAALGDAGLRGPQPQGWLERLEREHDNLRAALEWSLQGTRGDAGVRLAGSLGLFWGQRGHLREGASWLGAALAAAPGAPPAALAQALHSAGSLAWRLGDHARASAYLERGLELRRRLDAPAELARTLSMLGVVYSAQHSHLDRARACLVESLQIQRALGDAWMTAHSLNALGEIARLGGDLANARDHYAQALEVTRGSSDSRVAGILLNLGLVAFAQRDWPGAREFFERSLGLSNRLGEPGSVAACLDGLAGVHAECGDARRAARLLGAADALRTSIGEPVQSTDFDDHERFVAATRGRLDDATFTAEHAAGARLSADDAIESARGGTLGD